MFTIDQIKQVHAKVKSGADFPNYIQDLIKLGVKSYDTFVYNGHSKYLGKENYKIQSEAKYPEIKVAEKSDPVKFKNYLKIHQEGRTDYLTFCNHAAETGVEKWKVDTLEMTCTYLDKSGAIMLIESIPKLEKIANGIRS